MKAPRRSHFGKNARGCAGGPCSPRRPVFGTGANTGCRRRVVRDGAVLTRVDLRQTATTRRDHGGELCPHRNLQLLMNRAEVPVPIISETIRVASPTREHFAEELRQPFHLFSFGLSVHAQTTPATGGRTPTWLRNQTVRGRSQVACGVALLPAGVPSRNGVTTSANLPLIQALGFIQ